LTFAHYLDSEEKFTGELKAAFQQPPVAGIHMIEPAPPKGNQR